jgi:hypothetical protein
MIAIRANAVDALQVAGRLHSFAFDRHGNQARLTCLQSETGAFNGNPQDTVPSGPRLWLISTSAGTI